MIARFPIAAIATVTASIVALALAAAALHRSGQAPAPPPSTCAPADLHPHPPGDACVVDCLAELVGCVQLAAGATVSCTAPYNACVDRCPGVAGELPTLRGRASAVDRATAELLTWQARR